MLATAPLHVGSHGQVARLGSRHCIPSAVACRTASRRGSGVTGISVRAAFVNQEAKSKTRKATVERVVTDPQAPPKELGWWEKQKAPNLINLSDAVQLRRVLQRANELGSTRLVVVEFFAPHCPACRSLYPKLVSIARDEFPELLFVKLNVTACERTEELCRELGVESLPTFHLYSGSMGRVAQFTATLSAGSLEKLRTMLRVHSSLRTALVPGQRGPASVFHAEGWPSAVRPRKC